MASSTASPAGSYIFPPRCWFLQSPGSLIAFVGSSAHRWWPESIRWARRSPQRRRNNVARDSVSLGRFMLLLAVILAGGVMVNAWAHIGEAQVNRSELKQLPVRIGPWQQTGADERFDQQTENILRADDYLLRNYSSPE